MSTVSISKASRQNRLLKIIAGIEKHFANVTTITLGDVDRTPAEIKALIQSDIDASNVSLQVRQQLRAVVQVERNSHAKLDPILRLLKAFVIAKFGETNDASPKLGDFGFTPRKSTKKTVATKTVALGKNKA